MSNVAGRPEPKNSRLRSQYVLSFGIHACIQPYVHGHNYVFSVTLLHPIDMMQVCATRFTSTLGTGKSKCYTLYLEYVVTYMKHSYSQLSTIQFYRWTNGNQMTQPHIFLLYGHQVSSKQNIAETVGLI